MSLAVGSYVWLPCEVKPGPFANERLVSLRSTLSEWLGFVPASSLKEPISEGKTLVHALVLDLGGDRMKAQVPGVPVGNSIFEDVVPAAIEA